MSTTGTTWLGLTIGCARCHDHKYDPIKQKDFYRLAAYFNNVPEFTRGDYNGNTEPVITVPSPQQQKQIDTLESQIAAVLAKLPENEMVKQENQWRKTATAISRAPEDGLTAHYELDGTLADNSGHGHDASLQRGHVEYLHGVVGKAATLNGESKLISATLPTSTAALPSPSRSGRIPSPRQTEFPTKT